MADAAFEQFVGTSLPALMRHAYALTGNVHAGEDLVQDTLVRMAGAWRRIDKDGNPLAYARTVMLRTYLSRWRTLRRRPILQPLVETAAQGDAYGEVDVRDSLRRGLAGLPRMQRAVLVLTYLDDLADEDIAELLGRRPATIRSLRFRGLQALRDRFCADDAAEVEAYRGTN
ncbi:MAG TPA: SigE family RNA polymerase sigma factor [Asanoa sp.]